MLFEQHQAAVEAFITAAQRIPAGHSREPRAPGKWNPCQEAAHLVRTYLGFTEAMEGGADFEMMLPPERVAAIRDKVLPRILAGNYFPRGGISPDRAEPGDAPEPLPELLEQLRTASRTFESAVQNAETKTPGRIIQHPYFGPMALSDLVVLLAAHTLHHSRFISNPKATPAASA